MAKKRNRRTERKASRAHVTHDLVILFLSIYVILQLAVEVVTDLPPQVTEILDYADLAVCILFIADWAYSFIRASDKRDFAKRRFIDLLASIPLLLILRPLRIIRIVQLARALRVERGFKGVIPLLTWVTKNKSRSAMWIFPVSMDTKLGTL